MEQKWQILRKVLEFHGIDDIDGKTELIEQYVRMLRDRRDWAGLTSRSLPENIEEALVDSVSILSVVKCEPGDVVEIGSGGGLLGIVISVICICWDVAMVESSSRKSAFLAEVVGSLGIGNAEVLNVRAEQLEGEREFDLCLSRASGRLADLAPVALNLLKPGGKYVALKTSEVADEVEEARGAIDAAGGRPAVVLKAEDRPAMYKSRVSLVVIEKPGRA